MSYVTLAQLAESPGAQELAQVASSAHGDIVDSTLMQLTLQVGDRDAYHEAEVEAADEAKRRIEEAMADADATIDGYLGQRYALPIAQAPTILTTWARAITRYKLHKDRISDDKDPISRDYRDALKFLQQVAEGKFSIGLADPGQSPSNAGDVQFDPGHKVFGREHLP